ncbi:Hachiman antiphage defense system protein HamA [Mucilaginibacter sp.]|uniref:Hachiman antiphage defense system protein HamA n=1 Tax=Mucilaginibacter sp. TaxID=1882438 RepID=UPI0025FC78CA|nr:Hachiman antiphage defense system protein HamA [Mucilaginibacter sp.]
MPPVSGITLLQNNNCFYIIVNVFSDELKGLIRNQLAGVWNGFAEVEESPEIHSYKRTLNSFLDRYRDKAETTKKGMIGELLSHILINEYMQTFTSLSVLKNKEERSIKKGFDIIYFDNIKMNVWYSEVKSGRRESGSETSSEYNTILLNRSHTGISTMFDEKRSSLWESALIDVKLTIQDSKGRLKLKNLLD